MAERKNKIRNEGVYAEMTGNYVDVAVAEKRKWENFRTASVIPLRSIPAFVPVTYNLNNRIKIP